MALLSTLILGLFVFGQTEQQIVGKWEARPHGIPAVTLTIAADNGALHGNVVFYCLGKTSDGGWKVVGERVVPMLEPTWDGDTLSFKASYDATRCLPPYLNQPSEFSYKFTLSGQDEGLLTSGMPSDVNYVRLPTRRLK